MKRSFECTCSYDQDLQTEKAAGVYFHRVPSPPMLPTVEEAQRFYNELEERLQKFGLELARDKHGSSGSADIVRARQASSFWGSSFAGV
jgi:hypothetical protein